MASYSDHASSSAFIDPHILLAIIPLDNSQHSSFTLPKIAPSSPSWSSKSVNKLPLEIYQECLSYLDIKTLTDIRRVSQHTRHAIDDMLMYKEVYLFASQVLRGILAVGTGSHVTLRGLHRELTDLECYYCKTSNDPTYNFASYISLYEGRRACLWCLRNNPILRPVEISKLISLCLSPNFSIPRSIIKFVPQIRLIPDAYGVDPKTTISSTTLTLSHLITTPSNPSLNLSERKILFGSEQQDLIPSHHPFVQKDEESSLVLDRDFVDIDSEKEWAWRYASAILMPYLGSDKVEEFGVWCEECAWDMGWREERWRRTYERARGRRGVHGVLNGLGIMGNGNGQANTTANPAAPAPTSTVMSTQERLHKRIQALQNATANRRAGTNTAQLVEDARARVQAQIEDQVRTQATAQFLSQLGIRTGHHPGHRGARAVVSRTKRDRIVESRKAAARMYTYTNTSLNDAVTIRKALAKRPGVDSDEDELGDEDGLGISIQEHVKVHEGKTISNEEKEWRLGQGWGENSPVQGLDLERFL